MRVKGAILIMTLSIGLVMTGCATTEPTATVSGGGPTIGQAASVPYNGPKARLAVKKFVNRSSGGYNELGPGMADMLSTALFQSNRFIVLDRTDHGDVIGEQDLGTSGRIKPETAAPIGQMEGAELLVTGSITAFKSGSGGVVGGIGIGTGAGGGIGIGGGTKDVYMAMDIKVVDTRTGRIVGAAMVEGQSRDWFAGLGGKVGGVPVPFGLGTYKNTPAEKAIRVCIVKAVDYLASQTPANYFHGQ
jgi:curli biogenesis system outer membrane secretion channel CsgG